MLELLIGIVLVSYAEAVPEFPLVLHNCTMTMLNATLVCVTVLLCAVCSALRTGTGRTLVLRTRASNLGSTHTHTITTTHTPSDQSAIELWPPVDEAEIALVAELLGRKPQGLFEIVVRHGDGTPRVIRNAPILENGRPMPTLYWLVSEHDRLLVGRLEGKGGVDEAEAAVDPQALVDCHDAYRAERGLLIPPDYAGHRPSAGVGGTRFGVKCLHAHYAYFLARGDDPVGRWVADRLAEQDS
jgi:hypothetical protein